MKLDAHVHAYKRKGFGLKELVDYCLKMNLDMVAVTNFRDDRYEQFREDRKNLPRPYETNDLGNALEIYNDGHKIVILKGQEVATKDGHLLTLGSKKNLNDDRTLGDTLKEAYDNKAIRVADHPYVTIWNGIGEKRLLEFLGEWDAIEWNAQCINLFLFPHFLRQARSNELADLFAEKYQLPLIADSDTHLGRSFLGIKGSVEQIGLAYISFQNFVYKNGEDLIVKIKNIIRNKKYNIHKGNISRFGFLRWCVPLYLEKTFKVDHNEHN